MERINTGLQELLKSFTFVCRNCKHLWRALLAGKYAEGCGRIQTCGGPVVGRAFPDYEPIDNAPRAGDLWKYCYLCGKPAVAGLKVVMRTSGGRQERVLGLCEHHKSVLTMGLYGAGDVDRAISEGRVKDFRDIEGGEAPVTKLKPDTISKDLGVIDFKVK